MLADNGWFTLNGTDRQSVALHARPDPDLRLPPSRFIFMCK
jgi:hypothetical protein